MTKMQPFLLVASLTVFAGGVARAQDGAEANAAPPPAPVERPPACEPVDRGIKSTDVQKVFELHHVEPAAMVNVLKVFPARVCSSMNSGVPVISISASPAVVAAIEETIARLDVQPDDSVNIELVAYVLHAGRNGESDLPRGFDDVARHIQEIFGYSVVRLQDSLMVRTAEQESFRASAVASHDARTTYRLSGFHPRVTRDARGDRIVSIGRIDLDIRVPVQTNEHSWQSVRIDLSGGDIVLREGQRAIIGKSGIGEEGTALIVVLSARVVD